MCCSDNINDQLEDGIYSDMDIPMNVVGLRGGLTILLSDLTLARYIAGISYSE
jgi:hypothetical protein